jgi:hypothetical protein
MHTIFDPDSFMIEHLDQVTALAARTYSGRLRKPDFFVERRLYRLRCGPARSDTSIAAATA